MFKVWWPQSEEHNPRRPCLRYAGHKMRSKNMASSSYAPRFVDIIPQTWPLRVMFLDLWPSYLKHGLLKLCSSFCGHHSSNIASSSYVPRFVAIHVWGMMTTKRGAKLEEAMFEVWWPQNKEQNPRRPCLRYDGHWPPFLKHGLLELYSSFCGHHTSN
jgi:hypothetical protein